MIGWLTCIEHLLLSRAKREKAVLVAEWWEDAEEEAEEEEGFFSSPDPSPLSSPG